MELSEALEFVSRSDPGVVRSHNEDSVLCNPAVGVAILADGMGGYNAGEVASGMVTALLGSELERAFSQADSCKTGEERQAQVRAILETEIARANTAVYQASQSQPQYAGMGTTLVMGAFFDNALMTAHVGDSRMYRLRGEQFKQVTRDHSLLQEQIDSGMITAEDARKSQNKNLVTRAVGIDPTVEPEIHVYDAQPGDIYLLCSDGLNDMVTDEDIGSTVQMLSANLGLAATQLIEMANDNGGRDNVSVILVRVKKEFPAPRGMACWLTRLLAWFK